MQDVAAIVVDIAVIDPKSKVLLNNSAQVPPPNDNITVSQAQLVDYTSGHAVRLVAHTVAKHPQR